MRPGERLEKEARLFGTELCYIVHVFSEKGQRSVCFSPVKDQKKEDENENSEVLMVKISGLRILFYGIWAKRPTGAFGRERIFGGCSEGGTPRFPFLHRGKTFWRWFLRDFADISCRRGQPARTPGAGNGRKRLSGGRNRIFYTMKVVLNYILYWLTKRGWKLEQKFDRIERGDSYEHS